ncbi:MAG: PDZ domain-containing protein [Saprospiraceae bacterium]
MKKKSLLFSLFFLLITNISFSQKIGYQLEGKYQRRATIPFELINNLIVIPLKINGFELKFVVDTGVKYTILVDKVYSDILQIQYQRRIELIGADRNQVMTALVAPDVNMRLGRVFNPKETILVLEEDFLKFDEVFGQDVHGIIGHELFKNFIVKIDYDNKRLTLYKHEKFRTPKKSYKAFDIELSFGKPYIIAPVTFHNNDTVNTRVLLDTGASFNLLLDVNSNPKINFPPKTLHGDMGRGLGGLLDGLVGRVPRLNFTPFSFENIITFYQSDTVFSELNELSNRNGIIGNGILKRFKVIFDYRNQKLYLSKGKSYNAPFLFDMSGIILEEGDNEATSFKIKEILPNTPAEQVGLLPEDEIIKINYTHGKHLTRIFIKNLLKSKKNKKIRLVILRNGEKIKVKFRLKELI